jgi:hypothetical protein
MNAVLQHPVYGNEGRLIGSMTAIERINFIPSLAVASV